MPVGKINSSAGRYLIEENKKLHWGPNGALNWGGAWNHGTAEVILQSADELSGSVGHSGVLIVINQL